MKPVRVVLDLLAFLAGAIAVGQKFRMTGRGRYRRAGELAKEQVAMSPTLASVVVDADGDRAFDPVLAVHDPDLEAGERVAPARSPAPAIRTTGPAPLKAPTGEDHSKVRRSTAVSASVTWP